MIQGNFSRIAAFFGEPAVCSAVTGGLSVLFCGGLSVCAGFHGAVLPARQNRDVCKGGCGFMRLLFESCKTDLMSGNTLFFGTGCFCCRTDRMRGVVFRAACRLLRSPAGLTECRALSAFLFSAPSAAKRRRPECGGNACAVPGLLQGGFRHRFFTYRYVLLHCLLSDFHSANMKDFSKKRRKPFRRLYDDDLHAAYPPFLGYRLFLYEIQYACRNDDKCFQYNECAAGQEKGQQNSCSKRQNDHAEYLACVSDSAHPPSPLPHCCSDAFCFYCMRREGIRCMH